MSQRELRALLADQRKDISTRKRTRSSTRSIRDMSEETDKIAELETKLEEALSTIKEQNVELQRAKESDVKLQQRLDDAQAELETVTLRAEVEKLRALEKVRDEERERSQAWVNDLRERFKTEKAVLEEKIAMLEAKSTSEASTSATSAPSESSTSVTTTVSTSTPSTTVAATAGGALSSASSATSATSSTTVSSASASTAASGGGTTVTHSTPTLTSVGSAEMMAKFFETQNQLLAAQVQAASLPPLACFDGNTDGDDTDFLQWLERFEERARLSKWTEETKVCQLRLHLTKLAEQVFQMLPKEDKSSYTKAIDALKKRFRSVEIEELKGLEFHRRVQGDESIEQLGMDLQKLGRKAFPAIQGKEFDRLLKGRLYQALHPRWQRKLNAPRPDETFAQLFERARMLEQHEKQFTASAACRTETANKKSKPNVPTGGSKPPSSTANQKLQKPQENVPAPAVSPKLVRLCHFCHEPGHFARNCPLRSKNSKHESPGRSTNTSTAQTSSVEVKETTEQKELTEEELEFLLARCRLQKEQQMLQAAPEGNVACVEATPPHNDGPVIGPLLYCDLEVEGVPVVSMVDCGSQTTIISRSFLHQVAKHLTSDGKPLPELKMPTVRLYGKDGPNGRSQLPITAQVDLSVTSGGKTVSVTMFVQPDSAQECLLGTNASLPLGFKFVDGKGKPLRSSSDPQFAKSESEPQVAHVSLIQASSIPSRKCRFLKAKVSGECSPGDQFLFESRSTQLQPLGLSAIDSLVTLSDERTVLIPVQNFQKCTVDLPSDVELGVVEPFEEICNAPDSVSPSMCARVLVDGPGYHEKERPSRLLNVLDLSESDCSDTQLDTLEALLSHHTDIFEMDSSELGHSNVVQHVINTGDSAPIKQHPYRTPMVQRERIAQLIKQMEEQGIVKPSCSPWASPVVLVPKKDGSTRFCVDYRRLNTVTRKDVYPLPRIDDILDTLGRAKYFTTLDLSAGYWQVELDPESQAKTAFTSHCGLYEFTRMPFGLCNAPATFQRLMQVVLAGLEWDCCFVYIDDILIASQSFEEHMRHLQLVFERLRQAGLRLKPKKCFFLRERVPYLGFVISKHGIQVDPSKTDKVRNFPTPTDPTSVRSFVGLASYYRRFVPHFAAIAAPLHRLTKKDVRFEWSEECETAFCRLKSLLTEAPVLVYPRFGEGEHFLLETDASGVGLGAVLSQKQGDGKYHPVAYASRSLQPNEKNYPISELETLAIVWAVKYFRAYLLGHPCTVLTDHAACVSLLNTPRPSAKLARWAMAIQEMDLMIKHRSGRSNAGADALSRHPCDTVDVNAVVADSSDPPETDLTVDGELFELSDATQQKLKDLSNLQQACAELKGMYLYLSDGTLPEEEKLARKIVLESRHFDLLDGILHHENPHSPGKWCLAVPVSLRSALLADAHGGLFAGHLGEKRVYDRLRRSYWWQGMRSDVRKHCRSCLPCATRRGVGRATHPPLQPIPVGGPFHCIGVDILKLPLTYDGNQYVLVFLDYLTKWVEAFPIKDQKAETVARVLVEEVICRHGAPERLLSDRGSNFLSELVAEVCRLMQIKKINTSGYHPQTDGLVERFHRTLISMLSRYVEKHARDWDHYLPYMLYAYRVTAQESTRESPFFLLYGRDARQPLEEALDCPTSAYMVDLDDYKSELVQGLTSAWDTAAECIKSAQNHQKSVYDRSAKTMKYRVGDRVMVHMPHEATGKTAKLARPYFGPYRVLNLTTSNAEVRLIDKPDDPSIFVSLDRVRPCYSELPNRSWSGHTSKRKRKRKSSTKTVNEPIVSKEYTGPMTRSRANTKH